MSAVWWRRVWPIVERWLVDLIWLDPGAAAIYMNLAAEEVVYTPRAA